MDVWLKAERAGKSDSSKVGLARSPQQATAMSQDDARKAMQGARRDYPDYTWEMESGFNIGEFILHGRNTGKSNRNPVPVVSRRETSDSLRRQIEELRAEATRLQSESEKTKRAAQKLAERIDRLERTAL